MDRMLGVERPMTKEFIEGYQACDQFVGKHRNPYKGPGPNQPKTSEDWTMGWECRFYGESLND